MSTRAPRGNTQKDVNQVIWNELSNSQKYSEQQSLTVLDNPCGQGEWLKFLKSQRPNWNAVGIDLFGPDKISDTIPCYRLDSSQNWSEKSQLATKSVDIATFISGAMAFDNLSNYFKQTHSLLKNGATLIVTNDNTWTLRDRISFLFNGRTRRFKLNYNSNEGNWHNINIATLTHIMEKSGFQIEKVTYTSFYPEDYLFLPLAVLLWPWQWFYRNFEKSNKPKMQRQVLYPFSSLIGRHYVVFARKT